MIISEDVLVTAKSRELFKRRSNLCYRPRNTLTPVYIRTGKIENGPKRSI